MEKIWCWTPDCNIHRLICLIILQNNSEIY
jgi:hypothetical protein